MKRVLAGLLAALLTWFGLAVPLDQASASSDLATQTYAYGSQHNDARALVPAPERAPAARYDSFRTSDAVDPWSHGASSRSDGTATYGYDDPDLLAQIDSTGTTTESLATASGPGSVVISRLHVAANAGTKLGWSTGDDIYALTKAGNKPVWSTVRGRFWKNEASNPQIDNWSPANLDRMGRGLAPQRYNRAKGGMESMELSHEPIPYRDGGTSVIPRWPQDHAAVDPYRFPGY